MAQRNQIIDRAEDVADQVSSSASYVLIYNRLAVVNVAYAHTGAHSDTVHTASVCYLVLD